MALVSFFPPVRKEIPHEPGQWMEFRKPGNGLVTLARKAAESDSRRGIRDFGGEIFKVLSDRGSSTAEQDEVVRRAKRIEQAQAYDVSQFDRNVLLCGAANPNDPARPFLGAIANWSYTDPDGKPVAPTADQIQGNLEEATAAWAHQVVVDMIKPATPEEDKSGTVDAAPSA